MLRDRDKDWKKNWSVSVRSFFFFRGSTSLSGSHSPVNLSYVHICVCFDCLHRFLAHTEDVCVGTSTSCLSASMYASIGFSTHSEGPNVCMFNSRHRRHTTMCIVLWCTYVYVYVCIVYVLCIFSNFFFELRKTHQTQREILYTPLIRKSCEMRKNWLGWLLGRVGRSLIYFQSIGFFLR